MERKTGKSIATRILILIIGIVSLAFVTIGCIGGLAFRNLADGFLNIVEAQNQEFAQMLNRNSERAKNRLVTMFEENARTRGEALITHDSLNLKTPFLENSYTQIRESLQNSFNFDESMLLAAFVVIEGNDIKAWQYLDREHKDGLSLPIIYDASRGVWVSSFQGHPVLVNDPGMENLRTIEKATIRKVQVSVGSGAERRTVAAYEAIIPVTESLPENISERLQQGEAIAFLRYLISLELLDKAVSLEEREMQGMIGEQRKITQGTLENTISDANRRLGKLALTLISTAIGVIILAFAVSLWLSRRMALPIEELNRAADKIAQGDYDQAIQVHSDDEIGRLGHSFETMRVQVKNFTDKLQVLVEERTGRLNEALQTVTTQSRKIREIMAQIDLGILTIDTQQRVEAEYSSHLNNLYPNAGLQLTGMSVIDLVFGDSTLNGEDINHLSQSLACCLDGDILNWETNSDNFPRQVQYMDGGKSRIYELRWNPIVEDETIQRFLLTIRDKTKELVLEEQIRVAAQTSNRLTQALSDLVSLRADAVGTMLRDSHAALCEIEASCTAQGAEHRRNYVQLHTMKGAARSLGLKALALAIHEAEIFQQRILRAESFDLDGFEKALMVIRDELDFLRDVASRILKIKIDGQGYDRRSLFEMLAEEIREAENLCRSHQVELGGVVVEDRVIHWNPRFMVDAVQAFRHALTNSLDHGYFKPIKEGKMPPDQKAFFRIAATRVNGHVVMVFEDEGYGFDRAAIRALAENMGMELNSEDDYMKVLLCNGLSTAKEVTQLSGRGIGLSAIQTFAEEWHGVLQLMDNPPSGSRLVITLPEDQVLVTAAFGHRAKEPASA